MKVLDEKGRLFGKINIVDFLIVCLILVVIPAFIYIYKILGTRPVGDLRTWVRVEGVVFALPEFVDNIKPGVLSHDQFGDPDAKLLRIIQKQPEFNERLKGAIMSRYRIIKKDIYEANTKFEYRLPLCLELELLCNKNAKCRQWYFHQQPIAVNIDKGIELEGDEFGLYLYILKIIT